MKKWVCTVCGHVHQGDTPPEVCPLCKAGSDKFIEQSDATYETEHVIGVGAKDKVEADVYQGLLDNFNGECAEVGMYLAMSRAAEREGFPEIAEAYKRYAFEEADHAARFAELLGECVSSSTKTNLQMRASAELGATNSKFALAKRAKELGYDAIHDTVHEMAKDEARHGRGFDGLLERYF